MRRRAGRRHWAVIYLLAIRVLPQPMRPCCPFLLEPIYEGIVIRYYLRFEIWNVDSWKTDKNRGIPASDSVWPIVLARLL